MGALSNLAWSTQLVAKVRDLVCEVKQYYRGEGLPLRYRVKTQVSGDKLPPGPRWVVVIFCGCP